MGWGFVTVVGRWESTAKPLLAGRDELSFKPSHPISQSCVPRQSIYPVLVPCFWSLCSFSPIPPPTENPSGFDFNFLCKVQLSLTVGNSHKLSMLSDLWDVAYFAGQIWFLALVTFCSAQSKCPVWSGSCTWFSLEPSSATLVSLPSKIQEQRSFFTLACRVSHMQ